MYVVYLITAFLASTLTTKLLIIFLTKRNIIDTPNHRSNHKNPIPRGGGIAIALAILLGMIFISYSLGLDSHLLYLLLAIFISSSISFADDIISIPIPIRIIFQLIAVFFLICSLPLYNQTLIFHFLPLFIEKLLIAFALFSFINIYNFMDGIDGLSASQTIYIAIMTLIFSIIDPKIDISISYLCLSVIGACFGFLIYNWHPAKIFMGDVGSITLGLICGWLMLNLAIHGYIAAAIIIPGYYLADGITTILKRLIQKKKIWQAHSEHCYQLAVRKGKSHSQVTKKIIYCNIFLGLLSLFSITYPMVALILATIFVFTLLLRLAN